MPLSQLYHAIPGVSTKITILRISLAASRPAGRTRTGRPFPRKLERKKAPPFYPTRRSLFAFFSICPERFPCGALAATGGEKNQPMPAATAQNSRSLPSIHRSPSIRKLPGAAFLFGVEFPHLQGAHLANAIFRLVGDGLPVVPAGPKGKNPPHLSHFLREAEFF